MKQIFKLPDLGEGLAEAVLREWYIKIGDEVTIDQPLASMETDKALVDIPSPYQGKITALKANVDDTVKTGAALIEFDNEQQTAHADDTSNTVVGSLNQADIQSSMDHIIYEEDLLSRCTPEAWSLIQKNQIDLNTLENDLKHLHVISLDAVQPYIEHNKAVQTEAINGLDSIRQRMFHNISKASQSIAQVTLYDDADISHWPDTTDFTVNIIRAIASAIAKAPIINSIYDKSNTFQTIKEINCGIAMDSEHGLFVPVINDINSLEDKSIRQQINTYKSDVLEKRLQKKDTLNATILLSNFGMFGAKYATPMVMPPMMAIVGIGQSHLKPIAAPDQSIAMAKVLPISFSLDHRFITGGEAARFLAALIEALAVIK